MCGLPCRVIPHIRKVALLVNPGWFHNCAFQGFLHPYGLPELNIYDCFSPLISLICAAVETAKSSGGMTLRGDRFL
jgi:hypothetical protein